MNLKTICEKTEYICLQGSMDIDIANIAYDSGKVSAGYIFVCVTGTVTDGHSYIPLALSKKVAAIVIENRAFASQIPEDVTVLYVPESRYALALMSAAFFAYPADQLTTIGITGTKGKTTVSYMIKAILEAAGKKAGLIGTTGTIIDNEINPSENTTPEPYELHRNLAKMVRANCEYAIVEVSSQGLKLRRTAGITFDYGIFTNLSADHIGPLEHTSMEEYIQCKSLLFRQCRNAVVNLDDEHVSEVLMGHTCKLSGFTIYSGKSVNQPPAHSPDFSDTLRFSSSDILSHDLSDDNSTTKSLDGALDGALEESSKKSLENISRPSCNLATELKNIVIADKVEFIKENGRLEMSFNTNGTLRCSAKVCIPGKFSVYNALAAMVTCHLVGIPQKNILEGLVNAQVNGRVEMIPVPGAYTLIIDFAHNEASVRSLLETLLEYKPKRLICLYGCGGDRSRQRRYDMGKVTGRLAYLSVLTCDNPRSEKLRNINDDIKKGLALSKGNYIEIDDRKKAIAYCIKNAQPGDVIVLLGKGHENYQEINGFKYHFDEREVVADILKD